MPRLALLPALALLTLLPACDQLDAQRDFDLAARTAPSGITRTSENGTILSADADDWRVSPTFTTRIRIDAFFPNPMTSGSLGRLIVTAFEFEGSPNGLVLYRRSADGALVRLDARSTQGPGAYELSVPGSLVGAPGLYRLIVADNFGQVVTYGDVQVQ